MNCRRKFTLWALYTMAVFNLSLNLTAQSLYLNDHCDQAEQITTDSVIRFSLDLPCLDATSCDESFSSALGVWYVVEGQDELLEITTLADHDDDIFFHVYGGDCMNLVCVGNTFNRFFAEAGKEYRILVAKPQYQYGQDIAHFVIRSEKAAAYDYCAGALALACDSLYEVYPRLLTRDIDVEGCVDDESMGWLYLEGDGQIKKLEFTAGFFNEVSFQVFENECGNLQCIYRGEGNEFQLATVPGKNYYIGVTHANLQLTIPILIRMSCRDNVLNTTCVNAEEIQCSDVIEATLSDSLPIDLISPQIGTFPGLWYVLPKDSTQYRFTLTSPAIENLVIGIFKVRNGDCVQELTPFQFNPYPLNQHEYVVNAVEGEQVYIKVAYFNQPTTFRLFLNECNPLESNFICQQAIPVTCGDKMNFYETGIGDFGNPKTGEEGLWFSMEGSDIPYFLEANNGGSPVHFDIYSGDCETLELVKSVDFFMQEPRGIYLDLPTGQTYYVKASYALYDFTVNRARVFCEQPEDNVFCDFGDTISVDQTYPLNSLYVGVDTLNDDCGSGEGVWYTFIGNDSIAEVVVNFPFQMFSIYTGDCDSLVCFGSQDTYSGFQNVRFLAEFGQAFYIKFYNVPAFTDRTFRLRSQPRAFNAVCGRADTLICGENVVMEFDGTDSDFSEDCPGGWGLWYLIEGNDQLWRVHAPGTPYFRVFEDDCFATECLASNTGFVQFFAQANHTYYIKANSSLPFDTDLFADCYEVAHNTCEVNDTIGCGDTLSLDFSRLAMQPGKEDRGYNVMGQWFTHVGDGSSFGIENVDPNDSISLFVEIREEDCDLVVYSSNVTLEDKAWLWQGDSGVTYKILIASQKSNVANVVFTCVETPQGVDCENSLPIECGAPFAYSSPDRGLDAAYDLYGVQWVSFTGNGEIAKLHLLDPVNGLGYAYRLFESNGGCDQLNLLQEHIGINGALYFLADVGKTYFIVIGLTNAEQVAVDWTFALDCTPANMSAACDQALSLTCHDTLTASTLHEPLSSFGSCGAPSPGVWYTLEGDDLDYILEVTNTYDYIQPIQVMLGEGDCNTIRCLQSGNLAEGVGSFAFSTSADRDYFIKFEGYQGAEVALFDFTVSCKNQTANDSCGYAVPLNCGDQISASLVNLESDDNNACSDLSQGLYYAISGNGEEIALTFDAGVHEAYVVSVFENSCGVDGICLYQEMADTFRNKIQFLSKDSTAYFIKIAAGNQSTTSFDMAVSCTETPVNGNCEKAIQLQCQDTVDMSLVTPLGFTGETPCHFTEDARVYWYQLPKTDKIMSVNILEGQEAAHYIALISGTCNNLTCEAFFDINSDDIVLNTPEDFNYYLAIHGDAASVHGLKFVLECLDRPSNDLCNNPATILCGDTIATDLTLAEYTPYVQDGCVINPWKDIWYQFTGNGEIMELVFVTEENFGGYVNLFLAGDCNALSCIENGPWRNNTESSVYRFLTEEGQDYLFSIQHPVGDSLEFTLRCTPLAANDACAGAFDWVFGDTTSVSLAGSLGDETIPCYDNQRDGVWYSFEGDGGYVHFAAADSTAPTMNYVLMEGNCDDLLCLDKGIFEPNFELTFRTEAGSQYYLLVYGNGGLITSYQGPVMDNLVCSQAMEVACNDIVVLQSRMSLPDLSGSGCPGVDENTGWYRYTGTGENVHLDFSTSGVEGSLEILLACDDTCIYKHALDTLLPESFSFLGVEGVDYLLKLNISRRIPDQLILMEIGCEEGPENYNMATAIPLGCDTFLVNLENPYFNLIPECFEEEWVTYWYSFEGNDSLFAITDTFPDGVVAGIFDENCQEILALTPDSLSFLTQAGQSYFLVVRHLRQDTVASFTFGVNFGCIIIGTQDENQDVTAFRAQPNPFSDFVHVELTSTIRQDVVLEMWDSQGQKVSRKPWAIKPGHNEMTVNEWVHLPAGMYVLSISGQEIKPVILVKK